MSTAQRNSRGSTSRRASESGVILDLVPTYNHVPTHVRTAFYKRGGEENKALITQLTNDVRDYLLNRKQENGALQTAVFKIEGGGLPSINVDARVYWPDGKHPAHSVRLSLDEKAYGQIDTLPNNHTSMQLYDGITHPQKDKLDIIKTHPIKLAALFMHTYDQAAFAMHYPIIARGWTQLGGGVPHRPASGRRLKTASLRGPSRAKTPARHA